MRTSAVNLGAASPLLRASRRPPRAASISNATLLSAARRQPGRCYLAGLCMKALIALLLTASGTGRRSIGASGAGDRRIPETATDRARRSSPPASARTGVGLAGNPTMNVLLRQASAPAAAHSPKERLMLRSVVLGMRRPAHALDHRGTGVLETECRGYGSNSLCSHQRNDASHMWVKGQTYCSLVPDAARAPATHRSRNRVS